MSFNKFFKKHTSSNGLFSFAHLKILPKLLHWSRAVPYRIVQFRIVPQQTVYRSEKYRTIWTDLVLKTQSDVYRSVSKMQFFLFLNTKKVYERKT